MDFELYKYHPLNIQQFEVTIDLLIRLGLIEEVYDIDGNRCIKLTALGWDYVEDILDELSFE